jgi:hypothetical protein
MGVLPLHSVLLRAHFALRDPHTAHTLSSPSRWLHSHTVTQVLQVAVQLGCKARGIEIREDLHSIATSIHANMQHLADWGERLRAPNAARTRKRLARFPPRFDASLVCGDVKSLPFSLADATVVFMNNWYGLLL